MKSMFFSGILNQRETAWLGQATAFVATTPTDSTTKEVASKETNWWDVVATGIKSGAAAYGSYSDIKEAEYGAEGKEADAATQIANLRTQQIMQQTQAMREATYAEQNKIMGVDKTAFFIGAALLGLGVIGGAFYLMGKKK